MKILNLVCAHKDFVWNDLSEDSLKKFLVVTTAKIKTNIPNVVVLDTKDKNYLDDRLFSEISHLSFVRHNLESDWVVVNHYRRRFELPDYKNIYVPDSKKFDITVKELYACFHHIEDLEFLTEIIMKSNLDVDFKLEWIKSLDDYYFIPYNMASCNRKTFNEWIDILELLLLQFQKEKHIDYDTEKKKNKYNPNTHLPDRIFGFLGERISNCFWRCYSKQHNVLPVIDNPVISCKVNLLENEMKI